MGALDGGPADAMVVDSSPQMLGLPDAGVDASPDGAVVVVDMAIESVCAMGFVNPTKAATTATEKPKAALTARLSVRRIVQASGRGARLR